MITYEPAIATYVAKGIPICFFSVAVFVVLQYANAWYSKKAKSDSAAKVRPMDKNAPWVIKPVSPEFNWETCDPIPYRPFAGKKDFKVQMGIRNLSKHLEKWLLLENTYLERIGLRKQFHAAHPENTLHCHPDDRTTLAVKEYYEKAIGYMSERFPQYFAIDPANDELVVNKITQEKFPRYAGSTDPKQLLQYINCFHEEDVLFLLKDNPDNHDEEYINRAGLFCFPAGFDPKIIFDQPISVIHEPVPQYKPRLKLSMSRFFNRLEPCDLWERTNWSIQINDVLFRIGGSHGRDGDELKPFELNPDEPDKDVFFLRVERQLFTRLPKSRAVIMSIKTYLTPLSQIRNEPGMAEELIKGIDGLPEDLAFYKMRPFWGNAAKEYLREC